jgi:hypothetical protein
VRQACAPRVGWALNSEIQNACLGASVFCSFNVLCNLVGPNTCEYMLLLIAYLMGCEFPNLKQWVYMNLAKFVPSSAATYWSQTLLNSWRYINFQH